jgi:hypothetical protein
VIYRENAIHNSLALGSRKAPSSSERSFDSSKDAIVVGLVISIFYSLFVTLHPISLVKTIDKYSMAVNYTSSGSVSNNTTVTDSRGFCVSRISVDGRNEALK